MRLAARLTGWDVDILTPPEFQKGLQILEETVRTVPGITDEMLDRMGALGMISVFDVEEVGEPVLVQECGMPPEMAQHVVSTCAERGRAVAEQMAQEKAAEEARRAEEGAQADALLGGEGAVATDAESEAAADSILGITSDEPAQG